MIGHAAVSAGDVSSDPLGWGRHGQRDSVRIQSLLGESAVSANTVAANGFVLVVVLDRCGASVVVVWRGASVVVVWRRSPFVIANRVIAVGYRRSPLHAGDRPDKVLGRADLVRNLAHRRRTDVLDQGARIRGLGVDRGRGRGGVRGGGVRHRGSAAASALPAGGEEADQAYRRQGPTRFVQGQLHRVRLP